MKRSTVTISRENEGFFFYVRDEYFDKANEEQNLEIKRVLNALLGSKVIKIDHDVLDKLTSVSHETTTPIPPKTVLMLTGMVMSMLEGELHRVNDEDAKYELGAEQIFDFNSISTTFKLNSKAEKRIRVKCLKAGWEVLGIQDLIVRVKKVKEVRKLKAIKEAKKPEEPSQ